MTKNYVLLSSSQKLKFNNFLFQINFCALSAQNNLSVVKNKCILFGKQHFFNFAFLSTFFTAACQLFSFVDSNTIVYFSDCRCPMNSSLQSGLNVLQAQQIISCYYNEVTFDQLIATDDGEDKRLCLVYLHGKKSVEPLRFRSSVKNLTPANKVRQLQVNYDRFLLFGVPSDNRVVCMFTSDEKPSRVITRYHNKLFPGCLVWAIDVKLKGTLNESENVLIHTEEPLIPVDQSLMLLRNLRILPPFDIDTEADMKFFCFHSITVQLKFPIATTGLCSGKICDGQTGAAKANCVCIEKSGLSDWGVRGNITCKEFQTGRLMQQECTFLSVSFSKLLCKQHGSIKPDSLTAFNPVLFRRASHRVIQAINDKCGWLVIGWFKPSKTSTDSFGEIHHYHVVKMTPMEDISNDIEVFQYPTNSNDITISDASSPTVTFPTFQPSKHTEYNNDSQSPGANAPRSTKTNNRELLPTSQHFETSTPLASRVKLHPEQGIKQSFSQEPPSTSRFLLFTDVTHPQGPFNLQNSQQNTSAGKTESQFNENESEVSNESG